jgi:hypothetical protein
MSIDLRRVQTPEEKELARKLAELTVLEGELAQRELDLATLLAELHAFERRYSKFATISSSSTGRDARGLEWLSLMGYSQRIPVLGGDEVLQPTMRLLLNHRVFQAAFAKSEIID